MEKTFCRFSTTNDQKIRVVCDDANGRSVVYIHTMAAGMSVCSTITAEDAEAMGAALMAASAHIRAKASAEVAA